MSWKIKVEFIESCSCNMLCPCWYGVKELMIMDEGWCASPWLIRIGEGGSEDVDLSGCNVVLAMFFPGPTLLDGDGTGRLYLDKANSQAQRKALEGIFTGKRGGPMEVPDALLSTWLPTRITDIDVSEVDGGVDATVGEYGRIVSRRLINEQGDPVTMQNAGFALVWQFEDRITDLAPSHGSVWSDPDLPVSWAGKSGAVGQFTWGGQ
jgi:hypothetical protein